jgi:glycosyltransferase involved in cell wall biosynthesis
MIMQKQTILIVIDNLQKGGAEVLLVGILPELNERYEVILATLTGETAFDAAQVVCSKRYVLGFGNKLSFLSCVQKLKKIIRRHKPSVVHAHLFYSSLAARLACPSKIPLLYSVHNELSKDIFNRSRLLTLIEKTTIRKNHSVVAVSKLVLEDYARTIGLTKKHFILKNYISDHFFANTPVKKDRPQNAPLKLIAVGNLKHSKNYEYLLRALIPLKNDPVSLDIYGNYDNHPLYPAMRSLIDDNGLPVYFKGPVDNIHELFPGYDLYVMSSKYEGFGIAVVEAMASGLPALLSDLPVLREVSFDNALFFDIHDPMALAHLIKQITEGKHDLEKLSVAGIELAKQYTKQKYIEALFSIYRQAAEPA